MKLMVRAKLGDSYFCSNIHDQIFTWKKSIKNTATEPGTYQQNRGSVWREVHLLLIPKKFKKGDYSTLLKFQLIFYCRDNTEVRVRQRELHRKLQNLHGTKAFRSYLEKNGRQKPEFMNEIIQLQDANKS